MTKIAILKRCFCCFSPIFMFSFSFLGVNPLLFFHSKFYFFSNFNFLLPLLHFFFCYCHNIMVLVLGLVPTEVGPTPPDRRVHVIDGRWYARNPWERLVENKKIDLVINIDYCCCTSLFLYSIFLTKLSGLVRYAKYTFHRPSNRVYGARGVLNQIFNRNENDLIVHQCHTKTTVSSHCSMNCVLAQ